MTDPGLYGSDEEIREILREGQVWAVVGLSANPMRPAFGVARFLQQLGKRIVPVHPRADTVHGEPGFASLADIPFAVDVVDVFVRSDLAGAVFDDAIALDPKPLAVWGQLTVVDEAGAARARAAGLLTVMDRCPAIEWPLLGPAA